MAKGETNNWAVFGLLFIGSLFYLYAAFANSGVYAIGSWSSSIAAIWEPFLYAAAVISAIGLFFLSFGYLTRNVPEKLTYAARCVAFLGGFSLIALTAGSGLMFYVSVIGFIIAIIGAMLSYK
ncbi:MAG: hypothetical protein QW346_02695 [Candidatus Micrarchaeaceae archaeon]